MENVLSRADYPGGGYNLALVTMTWTLYEQVLTLKLEVTKPVGKVVFSPEWRRPNKPILGEEPMVCVAWFHLELGFIVPTSNQNTMLTFF